MKIQIDETNTDTRSQSDRRSYLKTSGAVTITALSGLAGCLGSSGNNGSGAANGSTNKSGGNGGKKPLTFGAIHLLSGFASVYGESAELGYEMARQEINNSGGINGRQIAPIIVRDSESSGSTGVEAARSLVQEEDVDGLMGLDSSSVSLAVAPVMKQLQKPLMVTHAATPFITARDGENAAGNKYVFRDGVNLSQNIYGAAQTASDLDATSWTTIGPNYAFGTQTWDYFKAYTKGMGSDYDYLNDATAYPELGASGFRPQINKVVSASPDGVITSLWGSDLVTFINQAKNTPFFDEIDHLLMTVGAATDALRPLGNSMPDGLWAGTRYWFLSPDSKKNNSFVKKFRNRNDGRYPSYNAQNAYTALYLYKKAIENAGSTAADDIISAWEGMQYNAPVGQFTLKKDSHQAILPAVWGKTRYSDQRGITVLDPVNRINAPAQKLESLLKDSNLPSGV